MRSQLLAMRVNTELGGWNEDLVAVFYRVSAKLRLTQQIIAAASQKERVLVMPIDLSGF